MNFFGWRRSIGCSVLSGLVGVLLVVAVPDAKSFEEFGPRPTQAVVSAELGPGAIGIQIWMPRRPVTLGCPRTPR